MKEQKYQIGDMVRYSWNTSDCGVVLKVECPYSEKPEELYLYVLWSKGETNSKKWWVPIDRWIVKV